MTANRGLKSSEHELKASIVSTPLDGSRAALDAALGAVDEAASRDIPLRLVYAIDSNRQLRHPTRRVRRELATAELSVCYAFTAVESRSRSRSRWRYCRATQPVR